MAQNMLRGPGMSQLGVEALVTERLGLLVGDHVVQPLEEDTILPAQYFTRLCRREYRTGAHRLMLGIFEDAVNIYCQRHSGRLSLRRLREVERWFESRDDAYIFSFERICQVLNLDADYIRRGLKSFRAHSRPARPADIPIEQYEALRATSGA
jgi:hypothetical protein